MYSKFYHTFIILVGCVFMLLLANNFAILFDGAPFLSEGGWIIVVAVVLTLLCWLRDVSVLAKVSFVAWLSCLVVIIAVFVNTCIVGFAKGENAAKAFVAPDLENTVSYIEYFQFKTFPASTSSSPPSPDNHRITRTARHIRQSQV